MKKIAQTVVFSAVGSLSVAMVSLPAFADDYAKVLSSIPIVQQVPGTSTSRLTGYQVKYEFQGKQYTVTLPSDPGPRLRVQGGANSSPPPQSLPQQTPTPLAPVGVISPPVPLAAPIMPPAAVYSAPVYAVPPPVVIAAPAPYYPYPYAVPYNPIVPFGIGVGIGVGLGYYGGGYGYRGWNGGGWHGGGWRGGGGGWHR